MNIDIDNERVNDPVRPRPMSLAAVPLAALLIVTAYASCLLQLAGLH
jgi:hypothetical protein